MINKFSHKDEIAFRLKALESFFKVFEIQDYYSSIKTLWKTIDDFPISDIEDDLFVNFFQRMFILRTGDKAIDRLLEGILDKIGDEKFPLNLSKMKLQYLKLIIDIFEKVNAKKGYIHINRKLQDIRIYNYKDLIGIDIFHKIALLNKNVEVSSYSLES